MAQPWFDYPDGHGYITSYQGPGTDTPHYAEDLQTPFHTSLTAPTSGTVKVADYQGWGGEIFVQPDDKSLPEWYMYHPDEVDVRVGQHVNAGQFIGLSGGENPGYPGALHPAQTQWSSGPHTHVGWFTKWETTAIGTRPYGPPPDDLIQMAKTGVFQIGVPGVPQSYQQTGTPACTAPTGVQALDPAAWGAYWGCMTANATTAPGQQAAASIAQWVNSTMGPFLIRLGVGIAGLALVWIGTNSLSSALEGAAMDAADTGVNKIQDRLQETEHVASLGTMGKSKEKPEKEEKKEPEKKLKSKPAAKASEPKTPAAGAGAEATGAEAAAIPIVPV